MKRIVCSVLFLLIALQLTACSDEAALKDGYYTAQAAQFSHGFATG